MGAVYVQCTTSVFRESNNATVHATHGRVTEPAGSRSGRRESGSPPVHATTDATVAFVATSPLGITVVTLFG